MDSVFVFLFGVIAGFLVSKLFKVIQLYRYHKDVADALLRCLNTENDYAQALGKNSMIEYTIETKGLQYAIFYYGSIYKLLTGQYRKANEVEKVQIALGEFLHEAMKEDIESYKREQAENKKNKKR